MFVEKILLARKKKDVREFFFVFNKRNNWLTVWNEIINKKNMKNAVFFSSKTSIDNWRKKKCFAQ